MARMFLALCMAVLVAWPAAAETGRITVTGEGEIVAAPDMAVVTLGVTSEARAAAAAMAANNAAMATVFQRLMAAGIEDRDIQTSNLSLSPRWEQMRNQGDPPRVVGFVASNQVSVRVRALDRLGEVLDLVVADGANTLGGLNFGVLESGPLLDEARRAAVADAIRKARLLAEAAGVTLGPLLEMSEAGMSPGPIPMARMEMAMAEAVPVAPGEVGLTASVTMVFAIGE